ncbi:hypothetical protein AXI76_gp204 [Pseudoalteromonas phage H101]|uniref:Uncharacterized protein n=1 Tax=Pseudoalteromonas phage H101 TaxID=1654919 RepID=A0A0H4J2D4_9CAUD|nr:hypothetical protein AXI76_gp204 [Pseudoalteromonas phage H101]AKO61105.1 hypothetical protein [Pseudoalteromonas phage H101]
MSKDINGHPLTPYQVVVDPRGQLLTVESFLPSGQVKCRNGCLFVHWEPDRLKSVNYKEDLL